MIKRTRWIAREDKNDEKIDQEGREGLEATLCDRLGQESQIDTSGTSSIPTC